MSGTETEHRTTCRICESACGLLATVQDGRVTGLRPDPEHPISRGYACRKGTTFHTRGGRIERPRVAGRPTDWPTALEHVSTALRATLERHGPDAIGLYSGNAMGHSLGSVLGLTALQRALGTTKHYSCLTLDNSEMFAVADWVFGHPLTTFVAAYEESDCLVFFGTDPLSSQPGQAQSHPDGTRQIRARREQLVVVDPRRSATARAAALHLAPRVGSDVYVLGYLVRSALDRVGGEPALREALQGFTLERAARCSGLATEALSDLDARIATAERPLVWGGLGILLGRHGTLGWWLVVCLAALTGQLGTTWLPGGSGHFQRLLGWLPLRGRDPELRSRIGDWPAMLDTLPAATLPADITTPGAGQLRALICLGGEPLRALPDSSAARAALEQLELLIHVGLFEGPSSSIADVVLPAASFLERRESGLHSLWQRPSGHVRLDAPVVPPLGSARPDWDILIDLCHATGRPAFGSRLLDGVVRTGLHPEHLAWQALGRGACALREPHLAVPELLTAIAALSDPEPGLRLLSSVRPPNAMNHWIRPQHEPAACVHPEDLAAAGLTEGSVRIRGPAGELELEVRADDSLARGTVVVPYGGPVNPNELVSSTDLEAFSGQPISNGTRVELLRVRPSGEHAEQDDTPSTDRDGPGQRA